MIETGDLSTAEARERLRSAGLVVRMKDSTFLGGRAEGEAGGIRYVKDAFSISPEEHGAYLVLMPGVGQLIEERTCATLRAAVEAVEASYARG